MKFLRYFHNEEVKPAIFYNGKTLDLSQYVKEISPYYIKELQALLQLKEGEIEKLPIIDEILNEHKVMPCIHHPGKIVAIGMNYIDHLERVDFLGGPHVLPKYPIFFQKPNSSVVGAYDEVYIPRNCNKLDYENELAVIIGKSAKYVDTNEAAKCIFGYCIANDVSDRGLQFQDPGQYEMGKSSDTFCPLGPYIVTPDEVDVGHLSIQTKVNGKLMQDGTTKNMVFDVPKLISILSKYFTLQPGDVILTGTPKGVQLEEEILGNEPNYLRVGDVVELSIQGLGYQKSVIQQD